MIAPTRYRRNGGEWVSGPSLHFSNGFHPCSRGERPGKMERALARCLDLWRMSRQESTLLLKMEILILGWCGAAQGYRIPAPHPASSVSRRDNEQLVVDVDVFVPVWRRGTERGVALSGSSSGRVHHLPLLAPARGPRSPQLRLTHFWFTPNVTKLESNRGKEGTRPQEPVTSMFVRR